MIWVSGEALVDFLSSGPVPGGGPANTAVALARLGSDVQFVGGLSTDNYGQILREHLSLNCVNLDLALLSNLPTAIAHVRIESGGSAVYDFSLDSTATFNFNENEMPYGHPDVLYIGSLATVIEPSASGLFNWAKNLETTIVFDPNIRSAVISDPARYRENTERWSKIADVIKLSGDDLGFLYPDLDEESAIDRLMSGRTSLVVLTRGAEGLTGRTRDQKVNVAAVETEVIDTVGAGDTVGAVLTQALSEGVDLLGSGLRPTLERAARAAALTCSRAGCNPPTAAELG